MGYKKNKDLKLYPIFPFYTFAVQKFEEVNFEIKFRR